MSYEIVYGKCFLRTSRGIVPMVLMGSSNVTTYSSRTGREVRQREWSPLVYYAQTLEMIEAAPDKLMDIVRKFHPGGRSENFKYRSHWMSDEDVVRFFSDGIRNAKTLEEIRERYPYQRLRCMLATSTNSTQTVADDLRCICESTKELEDFLDKAKPAYAKCSGGCWIEIAFNGNEPLTFPRQKHFPAGPVVAMDQGYYVIEYTDHCITLDRNPMAAIVFQSVDEAKNKLPHVSAVPYTFRSAAEATKPRPYALIVRSGYRAGEFICRKTGRSLSLTLSKDRAKRFATIKEAEQWYERCVAGRYSGVPDVEVVNIDRLDEKGGSQ